MEDWEKFEEKIPKKKLWKKFIFFGFFISSIFSITLFFSYFFVSVPTKNFPVNEYIDIENGMSVKSISEFLEEKNLIQHNNIFNWYDKFYSIKNNINTSPKAGKYLFEKEIGVFEIYHRLVEGDFGIKPVKITFPEGTNNLEIAKIIANSKKIKNFNIEKFLELAENEEGFLYPDTYKFSPFDDEKKIIYIMKENFNKKNKDILEKIKNSDKSLEKIMIMASLIQEEAGSASYQIQREVSGILWNRINKNMLLQVDAVFSYIKKEHISVVSYEDLKAESEYNTYKNKGLPPTPISNPTSRSMNAAFYPKQTKNIFYLTGLDGKFYYSQTYKKHLENKAKYIDALR